MLVWLGTISYSVYMSHAFVLWFFSNIVLKRTLGVEAALNSDGKWAYHMSLLGASLDLLASLLLVISVSHLCYAFVERPLRKKSREIGFQFFNSDAEIVTPEKEQTETRSSYSL